MSVLIIAEADVNHNGSFELAKKMADVAKAAGADIVKYQTAVPDVPYSYYLEVTFTLTITFGRLGSLEMIITLGSRF